MTPKCPSPIHPSLDPSGSTLSLDRYPRNIDTTLELRGLGEREKERRPEARELGAGVRNTHCFFPRRPSWRPQERSRFPLFSLLSFLCLFLCSFLCYFFGALLLSWDRPLGGGAKESLQHAAFVQTADGRAPRHDLSRSHASNE